MNLSLISGIHWEHLLVFAGISVSMELFSRANQIRKEDGTTGLISRFPRWLKWRYINISRKVKNYGYMALRTGGKPVVRMDTPEGPIRFEASPTWHRFVEIDSGGVYESALLNALGDSFRDDTVFYNVGARWGIFSMFADSYGLESGNIHNFEASPGNFRILKRNVGEDVNATLGFVSDSTGENSLTLDDYARTHELPTVMKVDIEGGEVKAIQGARNVLTTHKPELYIEVHPGLIRDLGEEQDTLIRELLDLGYSVRVMDHRSTNSGWVAVQDADLPSDGDYLLHAV